MSYPPPGPPYGQAPPPNQWQGQQQYPPQGQYQQAPQGQYQQPPQGQYQQAPPNQWQQQPGNQSHPQGPGYQPPYGQQGYQQPPPGQQGYQQPPYQQPYQQQQPPPGQQSYGQYGAPPPQHQPQQNWTQPPPQQQFGGQPQGQFGAPPDAPSIGFGPALHPVTNVMDTARALRKSMQGFGTNEKLLLETMARIPVTDILAVKQSYKQQHGRDLEEDIAKETSRDFEATLLAIARGPLEGDVYLARKACEGAGTNEAILTDVLVGRKNADLRAIKQAYHARYKYEGQLESFVLDDLSMKTKDLFKLILQANRNEEWTPINPQEVQRDVEDIYHATRSHTKLTEQMQVARILTKKSDAQIRAIAEAYQQRYHTTLEQEMLTAYSGHMEDVFVDIIRKALDPALRDAKRIEKYCEGPGTRDDALIGLITKIHWNREHLERVRKAYMLVHKPGSSDPQALVKTIKKETSGDYEKLLVAMIS